MQKRSFFPVLLVVFAVGNVLCQNADELPIPVETDNQFPPEYSESDSYGEDSKTTTAVYNQPMPTSTTDVPVSTATEEEDLVNDEGNETTVTELTQITPESIITVVTTAATSTTTDDQDNANANNETTMEKIQTSESTDVAAEPSELTPETTTAGVAAPILTSDDEIIKGSEFRADEPTYTTSGFTTVDVSASVPENDDAIVTNNEGETTAQEPTQTTSESTIVELPAPTLTNDDEQITDNQGSETTATESIPTTSDSTTIAHYSSELATDADQITVNEGSETTVLESIKNVVDNTKLFSEESCPEPCICITEADSSNYIVDCSDRGLTDFPTPIDPKTTTLKLENNQLTVIPKGISELQNLINLNANDNMISELEFGSISELPKLVSLKLANNRFLEYPKELENASNLDKLEELDLGGNEMKTAPEMFLNFKALQTITLSEDSSELVSQICNSLKETLATVCIKSCSEHSFLCSDEFEHSKDNSLDATLPGIIPFFHEIVKEDTKNLDDSLANTVKSDTTKTSDPDASETPSSSTTKESPDITPLPSSNSRRKDSSEMPPEPTIPKMSSATKDLPASDFSLRTAVDNAPRENVALQNTLIETPKEPQNNEADVKVGAKTTETKSGGVDKSVIAVIVAGMVIIVAVIAIKKNWSSIRKRFSSTPRPNDRNTNGTTVMPEEVPLQDKSPV